MPCVEIPDLAELVALRRDITLTRNWLSMSIAPPIWSPPNWSGPVSGPSRLGPDGCGRRSAGGDLVPASVCGRIWTRCPSPN